MRIIIKVTSIIRLISVLLAKQIHWVVEIYSCYLFLFVFKIRLRFTSIYSPFEKKLLEVPFINLTHFFMAKSSSFPSTHAMIKYIIVTKSNGKKASKVRVLIISLARVRSCMAM